MSEAVMKLRAGEREPWGAILVGAGTFAVGLALGVFAPGVPRSTPPCARGTEVAATSASVGGAPEVRAVPTPGHYFAVAKGTTLSDVAVRAYGTAQRATDIASANPGIEPTRLKLGAILYVPVGSERAPTTPASVARAGPPQ